MLPVKRPRHDLEEMNLALASNADGRPAIFALDADCFDEIFDYMSLSDLCAIGLTCKRLQHAAGKYFALHYPFSMVMAGKRDEDKMQTAYDSECDTNFAPYARYLQLHGDEIDVYRSAAAKTYRYLKKIQFSRVSVFTDEHLLCIEKMNMLSKVETIKIAFCTAAFRDGLLTRVLKCCTNLKCLSLFLWDGSSRNADWLHQHCPTLERLEIRDENFHQDDLQVFLRVNPQIKKLSLWVVNTSVLQMIQSIGMELDEFGSNSVIKEGQIDKDLMAALNEKGIVKNLKVWLSWFHLEDQVAYLKLINCINSAQVDFDMSFPESTKVFASLVNLKQLHLNCWFSSGDLEFLAVLTNLEELHLLSHGSLEDAIPLVRRSPKLRIIKARQKSNSAVDVKALNNDRKKLPNAHRPLEIYLDDEAYRQIRWTSIDLILDMVAIKRLILKKVELL